MNRGRQVLHIFFKRLHSGHMANLRIKYDLLLSIIIGFSQITSISDRFAFVLLFTNSGCILLKQSNLEKLSTIFLHLIQIN